MNGYGIVIFLHVLGACIWTGGHLVLSHAVLPRALRARDPKIVQDFEAGYEKFGIAALVLQVLTGAHLAMTHLPGAGDWVDFENPITRHVLAKIALLVLTIGLAIHARFFIMPKLTADNMRGLAWHIRIVTLFAVLFVLFGVGMRTGGVV